jgi:hypothetical protein
MKLPSIFHHFLPPKYYFMCFFKILNLLFSVTLKFPSHTQHLITIITRSWPVVLPTMYLQNRTYPSSLFMMEKNKVGYISKKKNKITALLTQCVLSGQMCFNSFLRAYILALCLCRHFSVTINPSFGLLFNCFCFLPLSHPTDARARLTGCIRSTSTLTQCRMTRVNLFSLNVDIFHQLYADPLHEIYGNNTHHTKS